MKELFMILSLIIGSVLSGTVFGMISYKKK